MPRPPKRDRLATRRRNIIFQVVVLNNRPLALKELITLLGEPEVKGDKKFYDAINGDINFLKTIGCHIDLQSSNRTETKATRSLESRLVYLDGPHTDDYTIRESLHEEQKDVVARLAANVICGPPNGQEAQDWPVWMEELYSSGPPQIDAEQWVKDFSQKRKQAEPDDTALSDVLQQLQRHTSTLSESHKPWPPAAVKEIFGQRDGELSKRKRELADKLKGFWEERNRLVVIDSGTTNIRIAEFLKEVPLPLPGTGLVSLTVCTNSRRIFETLGPSNVLVRTIIVGGQQRFRSPTIAGTLAELFLRTASILQFGMCVLGTTKIDLDQFVICTDSQEEANMKTLFMEKSSLRIICVDDSKLHTEPGRDGYRFASIDPKHVDLIIINSPFSDKKDPGDIAARDRFYANIRKIENRGVPVFVATSSQTHPYPLNGQMPARKAVPVRAKSTGVRNGPTDQDEFREKVRAEEKKAVARLAASVICGIPPAPEASLPSWIRQYELDRYQPSKTRDAVRAFTESTKAEDLAQRVSHTLVHLHQQSMHFDGEMPFVSREGILQSLKRDDHRLTGRIRDLQIKLESFWKECNRLIAVDSGTTNLALAEFLRRVRPPLAGSELCSLSVCTNSRRIFEVLGPSDTAVRAIIIGGQQKYRSPTIAGVMAESFLRDAALLRFGMCLLGSTKIDLDQFVACSDSQEEASMKTLLLGKSVIRILCVDHTKLQTGPGREAYKFASIDPKDIDLIITNGLLEQDKKGEKLLQEKVKRIEERGIPVLLA